MIQNYKVFALIPARGGSKGVPRKNIKNIAGKPLISWSIEAAKKSMYIDRVIVSTEDNEIAGVSKSCGAEIPFIRPAELADDKARSIDVVLHCLKWIEETGSIKPILILLQPTSPLRNADDIDRALESMFERKAKAVVSVCETDHHPFWANVLPEDCGMKDFIRPEIKNKSRQDLPKYYMLNGAIYIGFERYIRDNNGFLGNDTYAYIMPKDRSIDIDSEMDFRLAKILLEELDNND